MFFLQFLSPSGAQGVTMSVCLSRLDHLNIISLAQIFKLFSKLSLYNTPQVIG